MSTPTARSAPAPETPYYTWEVPGRVTVQLRFDVIDRILPEVMRGFSALPRRGAEVGGLLIGRVLEESPLVISLEDAEPIPCEYLTGPSYRMSPRDLAHLEASLEAWRGRPLRVVGWFRSHTRKDLFLDDQDFDLIQKYFSSPNQIVLAIKPFATRASIGGFFSWENGKMRLDAPHSQFPFHRRELGGGDAPLSSFAPAVQRPEPQRAAEPPEPVLEPKPLPVKLEPAAPLFTDDTVELRVPDPEPERRFESAASRYEVAAPEAPPVREPLPEPVLKTAYDDPIDIAEISTVRPPQLGIRSRYPLVIATALLIACGVLLYRSWSDSAPPSSPVTASSQLQLAVSQAGRQLDVSWDREAPAITSAHHGVLEIEDGPTRQELALSASQLRNGLVRYTRVTDQVNLKLEIFSSETASITESTRVITDDGGATQEIPPSKSDSESVREVVPHAETAVESIANPYKHSVSVEVKTPPSQPAAPAASAPVGRVATPRSSRNRRSTQAPKPAPVETKPVSSATTTPEPTVQSEPVRELVRPARRR